MMRRGKKTTKLLFSDGDQSVAQRLAAAAVVLDHAVNLREAVFIGQMSLQAAAELARERWAATSNLIDGILLFDRRKPGDGAEMAAFYDHDVAASRGEKITCLKVESPIGIPDTFDLVLDHAPVRSCRVTWRKATQIGVEFV